MLLSFTGTDAPWSLELVEAAERDVVGTASVVVEDAADADALVQHMIAIWLVLLDVEGDDWSSSGGEEEQLLMMEQWRPERRSFIVYGGRGGGQHRGPHKHKERKK